MNISFDSIVDVLKTYFSDLLGGIKKPGPYLIFDIATIFVGILFFGILARNYQTLWLDTYFYVFLFFLLSIFLKAFDRVYLMGLSFIRLSGKSKLSIWVTLFVYLMSPVIGGFAIGSGLRVFNVQGTAPPEIGIPLFFLCIVAYPLLFFLCAERRVKTGKAESIKLGKFFSYIIRFVSGFGIYLVSLYFLAFIYFYVYRMNIQSVSWVLRPVLMLVFILMIFLVYMPARIHYFIDRPEDRSNRAWFIFTTISLALYTLTGRHIL